MSWDKKCQFKIYHLCLAVLGQSCHRFQPAMLVGLPTYGPLTVRNGLKRLSGHLDLHLCLYWV